MLGARLRDRRTLVHLLWIAAILAVAVAARSFWVAYAPVDPTQRAGVVDMKFYHDSAVALTEGKGYVNPESGTQTAQWPPGYPLFLAALYSLLGPSVTAAWIANIFLGALTCVALFILGCLMVSQRVGVIAGLLLAVFPGHVLFTSLLLSEILFTFLTVIAMILMLLVARRGQDGRRWRLVLLGLVIGAAALVRGQGLFLVIVAVLLWWLYTTDLERAARWAAIVVLAGLVVIVPWTIRNYVAMHGLVVISTNGGNSVWMGNHEGANGRLMWGVGLMLLGEDAKLPPAEREVAKSNLALRLGLKYMVTHPWKELQLSGSKVRALYEDDEAAVWWINAPEEGKPLRGARLIADVADGFYFVVLAASAGGLLYWLRRRRSAVALPLLVVAVFTLGQLLFFGNSRFHFPMLPSFCLLAAVGLVAEAEYMRRRPKQSREDGQNCPNL